MSPSFTYSPLSRTNSHRHTIAPTKLHIDTHTSFSTLLGLFDTTPPTTPTKTDSSSSFNSYEMDLAFAELDLPVDGIDSFVDVELVLNHPHTEDNFADFGRLARHRQSVIEISTILEGVNVFPKMEVVEEDDDSDHKNAPTHTPTRCTTTPPRSPSPPPATPVYSLPLPPSIITDTTADPTVRTQPTTRSKSSFKYPSNFNMPALVAPAPIDTTPSGSPSQSRSPSPAPSSSSTFSRLSSRSSSGSSSPPATPKVKHTSKTVGAGKATKTKSYTKRSKPPPPPKRPKDCVHECDHCDKIFLCLSKLTRHMLTHTGDKPHKCYCGQAFSQKSSLKTHSVRHARDRIREGKSKSDDYINQFTIASLLKPKKKDVLAEHSSNTPKSFNHYSKSYCSNMA
eukprot:m.233277 g.233277  ORF g.233277 m.233277 type:complete len:396 (-) comp33638_c0_seq3:1648-2835(-)